MTKLVFIGADGAPEVPVPDTGLTFGRSPDCDLPIQEGSVSGHHGSLRPEGGRWVLRDNNSSNGTFVNGQRVTAVIVNNGDMLQFGDVQVRFMTDAPAPAPAPAAPAAPAAAPSGLKLPPKPGALPPGAKLPPKGGIPAGAKLPPKPGPAPKAPAPAPAAKKPAAAPAPRKEAPEPAAPALSTGSDWKAPELKIDPNYRAPEMSAADTEVIALLEQKYRALMENISQVVIGQASVVEEVLMAVFAKGHALLMGVPGLAKTLLISTLSHVLDLGFKRVQFTPDLMPSDITGTDVLEEDKSTGERHFRFVKGPIFTNMLLADEINRTPPKTQAALLEAMQEHHITVGTQTYDLPKPFFVLATQNPIEQEGTYPLPEAQMDRFMFNIIVTYPSAEDESTIITNVTSARRVELNKVMDGDMVLRIQDVVKRVPVAPHVIDYARNLVRATRPKQPEAPDFVREMVGWGAGPRAGLALINAAKARAVMHGRHHCTTADVSAVALPVLRHRCITTFAAEAAGVTSDEIVSMLVKALKPSDSLDI